MYPEDRNGVYLLFFLIENHILSAYLRTFERHGKSVNLVLVGADVLAENLGLEERRLRHLVPIGEQLRNLSRVSPFFTVSVHYF